MTDLNTGAPSYAPQWYGPARNPVRCEDRRRGHQTGYPPDTDCTSLAHGSVNAHALGLPATPYDPEHGQLPCDNSTTRHGAAYSVCHHCNNMYKNTQWYKVAVSRIERKPPAPKAELDHWRGFLTRMCTLCEQREQYLVASRRLGGVRSVALNLPDLADRARMKNYPVNTCTCRHTIDEGRLCRRHRKDQWDRARARVVAQRNANMTWLHESAHYGGYPLGGNDFLRRASERRRTDRDLSRNNCIKRGCRCGREVTAAEPQVYQCMACQGIVQVTEMSNMHIIANPPNALQQVNSSSAGGHLRIPRDRSDRFI